MSDIAPMRGDARNCSRENREPNRPGGGRQNGSIILKLDNNDWGIFNKIPPDATITLPPNHSPNLIIEASSSNQTGVVPCSKPPQILFRNIF